MSSRPPWVKPALSFGLPLLVLVVALPYLTGRSYGLPSLGEFTRSWRDTRSAVGHAVAGNAAGGAKVRFYECTANGARVLSSTPCGPGARIHDVDPAMVNHERMDVAPAADAGSADRRGSGPRQGLIDGVRSDLAKSEAAEASRRIEPE